MEEDGGVKAPLTRLRRRLSVEQPDDTKSPSAPSTPTKKRGRLAAKPQLELIDENAAQNSPKRSTRKSIAREIIEPTEEKPVTPARRTTRTKSNTSIVSQTGPMEDMPTTPGRRTAKSNTSIVSETGPTEDKAVTPARRNTRTKSNTSITSLVSETAQTFDSPRAKRAARRTSQVGSDNEAPVTPARIRRTRKDSTSSIDKQVTPVSDTSVTPGRTRRTRRDSPSSLDNAAGSISVDKPALITEVISEEPEANDRKAITSSGTSDDLKDETSPSNIRKSPRIVAKKSKKGNSSRSDVESNNYNLQNNNEPITLNKSEKPDSGNDMDSQNTRKSLSSEYDQVESNHATESGGLEKDKLSISSTNLIKNMNTVPKKKTSILNKSSSDVEDLQKPKNKRNRTKSWTTLSVTPSSEGYFFSDNESTKKNLKQNQKLGMKSLSKKTGSDDSLLNMIKSVDKSETGDISDILLNSSMKRKKKHSERSFTVVEISNKESFISEKPSSNITQEKTPNVENVSNESNKEDLLDMNSKNKDTAASELLFEKAPSGAIKTILYLDDSDTDSIGKSKIEKQIEGDDQCVPVVNHRLEKLPENPDLITLQDPKNNDSCEPMDIDDTIPDNVTLNDSSKENRCKNDSYKLERENVIPQEVKNDVNEGLNKSDKNSSISHRILQDLEKSENENKSTLILSQIKDVSNENNVTKSSLVSSNKLSAKSISSPVVTKNGIENKSSLIFSQNKDVSSTENKTPLVSSNEILSKSNNISAVSKNELVKQNLSQNYLTSTPVHKKNTKKLDLPMNTSLIAPDEILVNYAVSTSVKNISNSTSLGSEDSDNSDLSDEEESMHSRGILDDEADDAGDDYESGDSQDEEDRQYIRDHEILDKGEALTSDDEISNDSDYEKDSFLVSSDEEDRELLSGSGDDLAMSDNELTFSAKSKKKYDDRKKKEQKKASKEMFEARHKLNEKSSKSQDPQPQKKNRLRLDSTLLESGDDVAAPPKKNKRLRLESSQDSSIGDSTSEAAVFEKQDGVDRKNKKKSKRLSDYSCSESAIIENEITAVCDKSAINKDDPLLMLVKQEPKTPQREHSISAIHFTDREDIERVQVDENMSLVKPNESFDPLQATMAQEDESESISENEEITKNYDSILNELNEEIKPKQRVSEISLNLNKKTKQKKNEPIVEELNLTQTKMTKSKKKSRDVDSDLDKNKEMSVKTVFKKLIVNHEESSDSIDLRLLFSDDSNDGGKDDGKKEMSEDTESFIPLTKSEGKTNIRGNMNANENDHNESLLNTSSKKKNKKRKSSQNDDIVSTKVVEEENVNFFFDTTGTRLDLDTSTNTSLTTSLKKNKNKKNSISFANDLERSNNNEVAIDVNFDDDAPTEVSFISEKHKDKTSKKSTNSEDTTEKSVNVSFSKTPNSEKKKKKKKTESRHGEKQEASINVNSDDAPTEASLVSEKRKKKTKISENNEDSKEKSVDVSVSKTPNSEEKKKNLESQDEERHENHESAFLSYRKMSEKKKKKQKSTALEILDAEITPQDIESEYKVEAIEERTTAQKRKRKSSANHADDTQPNETTQVLQASKTFNKALPNANQKKKRKVSLSEDSCVQNHGLDAASNEESAQLSNEKLELSSLNKAKSLQRFQNDSEDQKQTVSKKRKKPEEDEGDKRSKIPKENSFDKIHVTRLPSTFINQLEDKSRKEDLEMRKLKVVATSEFKVEETKKRQKIQPSTFLEESIYLNTDSESPVVKKQKANIKKPKVLPFIPTATTSYTGFTTNFQVNVVPQKMEFVAQRTDQTNFRNDYLRTNKLKKLRTYELYKQHRNVKLSKY